MDPTGDPEGDGRYIVFHVRSSPVNPARERSILETLESIAAAGVIDDFWVRTWPEKVSLRTPGAGRGELVETFEALEQWAHDHGVSVCPPFLRRDRSSAFTGERDEVLLTPAQFLTVYDGDQLAGVYPCHHDGTVTTIDDWLEQFAATEEGSQRPTNEKDRLQPVGIDENVG